ncbi:PQQ-dependent sugar dehydrogenase [Marinivivus vitaminiproducens]|uniref:PQQ-dependent sugar dehydrogenase n=1 Tax=Marinivivus vitaminiproducens TaxID=3035935 RepID=UPI0027A069DD|nr:PQQ-dependent sugar dehydrogenase [Geminicoccaceae bacterium SCSIO 64248]
MRSVEGLGRTGLAMACAAMMMTAGVALAQDEEAGEDRSWAVGQPNTEAAMKMAPIAQFPVPTAEADLPTARLKAPPGFKVETYVSDILDARMMREGANGTLFVSSLFVAGKVYAVVDNGGTREVKTIVSDMPMANGVEFHDGSLYVATNKMLVRYDDIENKLDAPPEPVTVYDKFPGDVPHGWKFLKIGPDGKLYVPVGAPCNICMPSENHARILRMNLDGTGVETVAEGVRNTVGFDFNPRNGELWFTDNQRDWLSEDMPIDELNRITEPGQQHFGFPYCHSGILTDPEHGWGHSCSAYARPAALLGPHSAPLGMRFYTGSAFPEQYRNAIFIARHGPWNRTNKYADVSVAYLDDSGAVTKVEPFLTGFVENNEYVGRPVDIHVMDDGSILVSDDYNGAIYRVSYEG